MQVPVIDITAIYPEVIVALVGLLVIMIDIFIRPERKAALSVISLVGLLLALFLTILYWDGNETAFSGMVVADPYAQFFKLIFILSAAFTILISPRYLRINEINQSEFLALTLFCTLGMMVMVAANDLVTVYIGLELMAISIYLMAGFQRKASRSSEASMKYFLLGAFASAILLYGMSFLYGITRSTSLEGISRYLDFTRTMLDNPRMVTLALVLVTVGFAFKIAAVPFHMWTPDVYEGAPTPLTAFMSVGPKVAGFAVIMRIYMTCFDTTLFDFKIVDWTMLFWIMAVLTMVVGNVIAVAQTNIKRMLAYSSIAHAGYLLVGVVSAGSSVTMLASELEKTSLATESMTAVMVYLFAYMFMNMGAFAIVIALGRTGDPCESLEDYAGLARRRPLTALIMAILLFSLAGIPPTFGFMGKLYIFKAAIQTNNIDLAVIGVLASVVAAFYYIRVIVNMYMREPEGEAPPEAEPAGSTMYAAMTTCIFTLLFGVAPDTIVVMARYAIESLLG